jgi:hypothetical protein
LRICHFPQHLTREKQRSARKSDQIVRAVTSSQRLMGALIVYSVLEKASAAIGFSMISGLIQEFRQSG